MFLRLSVCTQCRLHSSKLYISGASIVYVDLRVPIKDKQEVIDKYRKVIREHSNIKLAIIGIVHMIYFILWLYGQIL